MNIEEAKNRKQNIMEKLNTLNKALKEAASLGLIIKADIDKVTQVYPKRSFNYTEIRISVGINPDEIET